MRSKILISGIFLSFIFSSVYTSNNINDKLLENKTKTIDEIVVKSVENSYYSSSIILSYKNQDHLYTWGDNSFGQLGYKTETPTVNPTPREVDINGDGIYGNEGTINEYEVSKFGSLVYVTDEAGIDHLYGWGTNRNYIYNSSALNTKVFLPFEINLDLFKTLNGENLRIKQISLSDNVYDVNCNIITNDSNGDHLFSWGYNENGSLGLGKNGEDIKKPEEVNLEENTELKQVESGSFASFLITHDDSGEHLYSAGKNSYGFLGIGSNDFDLIQNSYKEIFLLNDIVFLDENYFIKDFSIGNYTAGMIIEDNETDFLFTWGFNGTGLTGQGSGIEEHKPTEVNLDGDETPGYSGGHLLSINMISASSSLLTIDNNLKNHLYSCGENSKANLGTPSLSNVFTFTEISNIKEDKILDFSLGNNASILLTIDNNNNQHLYVWGQAKNGQLTENYNTNQRIPVEISKVFPLLEKPQFNEQVSTVLIEDKIAIQYDIVMPTSLDNQLFKEEVILNEINITDGTNIYGSVNNIENPIETSGQIILNGLIPGKIYSEGELYVSLVYDDFYTLDYREELNMNIPEFQVPPFTNTPPTFVSVTEPIFDSSNVGKIDFSITIPDENVTSTVVSKIQVVDAFGNIHGVSSTISETGTITLTNLEPGKNYSEGELYLELTYIESDGSEIKIGGSDVENSKIPAFTVPNKEVLEPSFNSQSTFNKKDWTISYDLMVSTNVPNNIDTVINKIEVKATENREEKVIGFIDNTQNPIPNKGEIPLNINTEYEKTYSNIHLVITYNDDNKFNELGQDPLGSVENIVVPDAPIAPFIVEKEISNIKDKHAILHYELEIPSANKEITETIITNLSVKDSEGNTYGSISKENGLPLNGEIDLKLKSSTNYDDLYLEITYNGITVGGTELEGSQIDSFETKFNRAIIYSFASLLILIILLVLITIILFNIKNKRKIEKKYHIDKTKK